MAFGIEQYDSRWFQVGVVLVCIALQVCVRAAPLEPGSPVAKELRNGGSPFAVDWQQLSAIGGTGSDGQHASDVTASQDAAATAADIIGFEQRKVRVHTALAVGQNPGCPHRCCCPVLAWLL